MTGVNARLVGLPIRLVAVDHHGPFLNLLNLPAHSSCTRMAASFLPLPFLPRPIAYSAERFAQSSSSANCWPSARLIALVTMRSSSGTERDGRSAANRSATALARSSGGTGERYLDGALYGQGALAQWRNSTQAIGYLACWRTEGRQGERSRPNKKLAVGRYVPQPQKYHTSASFHNTRRRTRLLRQSVDVMLVYIVTQDDSVSQQVREGTDALVQTFRTGAELIARTFGHEKPDLIFIDLISTPDGLRALQFVKGSGMRHIPVVAIANLGQQDFVSDSRPDDILYFPFLIEEVESMTANLTERKPLGFQPQ